MKIIIDHLKQIERALVFAGCKVGDFNDHAKSALFNSHKHHYIMHIFSDSNFMISWFCLQLGCHIFHASRF